MGKNLLSVVPGEMVTSSSVTLESRDRNSKAGILGIWAWENTGSKIKQTINGAFMVLQFPKKELKSLRALSSTSEKVSHYNIT